MVVERRGQADNPIVNCERRLASWVDNGSRSSSIPVEQPIDSACDHQLTATIELWQRPDGSPQPVPFRESRIERRLGNSPSTDDNAVVTRQESQVAPQHFCCIALGFVEQSTDQRGELRTIGPLGDRLLIRPARGPPRLRTYPVIGTVTAAAPGRRGTSPGGCVRPHRRG